MSFLHILDIYQIFWFAYFLSFYRLPFILLIVSCAVQKLFSLRYTTCLFLLLFPLLWGQIQENISKTSVSVANNSK